MSSSDDYSCHVQIINNSTSHNLSVESESKNKYGQRWNPEPQNQVNAGQTSNWAVLVPGTSAQGAGGYITYDVSDNGTTLTLDFSNPKIGDNKASFEANGVNISFVTKVGNGDWSAPGTVAQGPGPLYVQYTLS